MVSEAMQIYVKLQWELDIVILELVGSATGTVFHAG